MHNNFGNNISRSNDDWLKQDVKRTKAVKMQHGIIMESKGAQQIQNSSWTDKQRRKKKCHTGQTTTNSPATDGWYNSIIDNMDKQRSSTMTRESMERPTHILARMST